jgi:hypothetical protein
MTLISSLVKSGGTICLSIGRILDSSLFAQKNISEWRALNHLSIRPLISVLEHNETDHFKQKGSVSAFYHMVVNLSIDFMNLQEIYAGAVEIPN